MSSRLSKRQASCRIPLFTQTFYCALDVETTSVHLIAMQKLMAAPMITKVQGGDTYRRQILWLMHPNFRKSNSSCSASNCSAKGMYYSYREIFRQHYFCLTPKEFYITKASCCTMKMLLYLTSLLFDMS